MKNKKQKPLLKQKWNKHFVFYHNKGTLHFVLGVAKRGDYVAGHELTTHPSLNKNGKPKKKYILLQKNPNPGDVRNSYADKHLRKNIRVHFQDTWEKRLVIRKKWKLSKKDKKYIKKLDKKKI